MLFYAIIGIVVVVALIALIVDAIEERFEFVFIALCMCAVATFAFVASSLICLLIGTIAGTHSVYDHSNQLRQVATGSQIHGSFFLGTGTVDSKQVYIFYRVNNDGSLSMDNVPADHTVIMEDSSTPRIDTYHEEYPKWDLPSSMSGHESYVIHVPPNSIAPMVNLNLSGS